MAFEEKNTTGYQLSKTYLNDEDFEMCPLLIKNEDTGRFIFQVWTREGKLFFETKNELYHKPISAGIFRESEDSVKFYTLLLILHNDDVIQEVDYVQKEITKYVI